MALWDSDVEPEAQSAFRFARQALRKAGQKFVDVIVDRGHAEEIKKKCDELEGPLREALEEVEDLTQTLQAADQEVERLNYANSALEKEADQYKRPLTAHELEEARAIREYIDRQRPFTGGDTNAFLSLHAEKKNLAARLNALGHEKQKLEEELKFYKQQPQGHAPRKITPRITALVTLGCFIIGGLLLVRHLRSQPTKQVVASASAPSAVEQAPPSVQSPENESYPKPTWCSRHSITFSITEKIICESPSLSHNDIEVMNLYQKILRGALSPEDDLATTRLASTHEFWLATRWLCANDEPCLLDHYGQHIKKITSLAEEAYTPPSSHKRPSWCFRKSLNSTERVICKSPTLSKAEIQVENEYRKAMKVQSGWRASSLRELHKYELAKRSTCQNDKRCLRFQAHSHYWLLGSFTIPLSPLP